MTKAWVEISFIAGRNQFILFSGTNFIFLIIFCYNCLFGIGIQFSLHQIIESGFPEENELMPPKWEIFFVEDKIGPFQFLWRNRFAWKQFSEKNMGIQNVIAKGRISQIKLESIPFQSFHFIKLSYSNSFQQCIQSPNTPMSNNTKHKLKQNLSTSIR